MKHEAMRKWYVQFKNLEIRMTGTWEDVIVLCKLHDEIPVCTSSRSIMRQVELDS